MRIGMQTWGSEGDARPFLALGLGLARAGHRVTLAISCPDGLEALRIPEHTNLAVLEAGRLAGDQQELDGRKRLFARLFRNRNPLTQLKMVLAEYYDPFVGEMYDESVRLCADNEIVVSHFVTSTLPMAARKAGRPLVSVATSPYLPTRELVPPGMPRLGGLANLMMWRLGLHLLNRACQPGIDTLCSRESIKPVPRLIDLIDRAALNLVAVSPTLSPRPSDWRDSVYVSGFLNPPSSQTGGELPPVLEAFLAAGSPPVYITFGSMVALDPDPTQVTRTVIDAVKQTGCRAIVQSRWDVVAARPSDPNICCIESAPHNAVFPRCAAVVHHGGAGTTQSAVLARRPSVVVVHMTDQLYWGSVLHRLRVAPRFIERRSLTAKKLARAIRCVLDNPGMRERAERLGEHMRNEDGVATAVDLIDRHFGRPAAPGISE
ncbi:MAG: glycosyltransferase [Acidobacteriota bacterium]